MNVGIEACFKRLQLPWCSRDLELAPHAFDSLLCSGNKTVEHGHEAQWDGNRLDSVLAHNKHRVEVGLTCQGEGVAAATNPKFSAPPCSYGADYTFIACLFAHSDPGEFRPRPVLTNPDSASFPITTGQQVNTLAAPHDPAPSSSSRLALGAAVPAVGRAVPQLGTLNPISDSVTRRSF